MRTIENKNLSAPDPLTPLHPGEAIHYARCNLTNRLVHPDSIVENSCNQTQIIIDRPDDEDATPHKVGVGVVGEVTAAMVQAVRDQVGGAQ